MGADDLLTELAPLMRIVNEEGYLWACDGLRCQAGSQPNALSSKLQAALRCRSGAYAVAFALHSLPCGCEVFLSISHQTSRLEGTVALPCQPESVFGVKIAAQQVDKLPSARCRDAQWCHLPPLL